MNDIHKLSAGKYILCADKIVNKNITMDAINSIISENKNNKRGTAHFFELDGLSLVSKHYYRGGLAASLNKDKYLWSGFKNTRVFREWHLLETMQVLGLPTPIPVMARVQRHGLFYTADLITQRIMGTVSLGEKLKTELLPLPGWHSVGEMIRLFHEQGIYHADLNAGNILIADKNELYLVDFDKSQRRMKAEKWMDQVLARLKRSLIKFKTNNQDYHFEPNDWQALLNGYQG